MMVGIVSQLLLATTVATLAVGANGFYIPGVQPQEFEKGEEVHVKVNAITSIRTQVPKDFYGLPFCIPEGGPRMASQNLGEFLTGNKIQSSAYKLTMKEDAYCQKLCRIQMDKVKAANLRLGIKYGYHNNWIIDNLPSAFITLNVKDGEKQTHYAGGFPIGFVATDTKEAYVYNHVNIHVQYHQRDPAIESYRVVGFSVEPMSIAHEFDGGYDWDGVSDEGFTKTLRTCQPGNHMERSMIAKNQLVERDSKILYTYDVIWKESDISWSTRWDIYLNEDHLVPAKVHWYAINNSILLVFFLSYVIISILIRNLQRDTAAYNSVALSADEEKDEEYDETGWKHVHADVFQPPETMPMMYCVCIGGGAQLIVTIFFVIVFSAVGFLNPAKRGSLVNGILFFYLLSGVVGGYVSSALHKAFRGSCWERCAVTTAVFFPGIAFFVFLLFNTILSFGRSTACAPFLYVISLAAMWCFVLIPLTFLGAYFGYKHDALEFPTITSTIACVISPPHPFLQHPMALILVAGVMPFATIYVELSFIMESLWMNQYYYVFGFTLIVYLILIITCAEVTVLLVYYQLCTGNNRWWWFSFFASGSTALYTFIYSIFWFHSSEASNLPITYMLYFGYMALICSAMLLVTGTVGALASLWFIQKIFGTMKSRFS